MFAHVIELIYVSAFTVRTALQMAQANTQVHFMQPAPLLKLLPSLLLPPSPINQPPFPVPSPVHTSWPSGPAHTPASLK